MLEVILVLLALLFYVWFFNIFPIWELKTPFFHSLVVNLSQTQKVSNFSVKAGHLQVMLYTVTTQQVTDAIWQQGVRLGQEVKREGQ